MVDYSHDPRLKMRADTEELLKKFFFPFNRMLTDLLSAFQLCRYGHRYSKCYIMYTVAYLDLYHICLYPVLALFIVYHILIWPMYMYMYMYPSVSLGYLFRLFAMGVHGSFAVTHF